MKPSCIDPETLAAFAEGTLKRADIAKLLPHLEACETCSRALETAMEVHQAENVQAPKSSPWWLAVAAAVALALLAVPLLRNRAEDHGIARLVALAPRSARIVEPRLSGGFPWAAYRGPMRAADRAAEAERLKLGGAAGELIGEAERERTPDAQHAAGVALVLIEEPLRAAEQLRLAAEHAPNDPKAWNDLAVARYAAASRLGRASLYPQALAAADRALALEPRFAEALFNRALIAEKLGLADEARAAWQRYLEVDPSSPWADEARAHLTRLGAAAGESPFQRELPRLEKAAVDGDAEAVRAVVARFPQQARTFGEAEHLGLWGEAVLRGDPAEAQRLLAIARAVGAALAATSGEPLLRDAVLAIDTAQADARAILAEAHTTYRAGRIVYSRQRPSEAEPQLRRAAELFTRGGSPMALVARYFAANTRFDQHDAAGARAELEPLLPLAAARGYTALGAQVQWELGLCATVDADWLGAVAPLAAAEAAFRRLGERSNAGFMASLLAQTYSALGRPDEAWASWGQAFALMSAEPRGDRLPVALHVAVISEANAGRRDAALALVRLATAGARAAGNDALLSNAFRSQAMLEAELGQSEAARRTLASMTGLTPRIADPKLRERASHDVALATGAVLLQSEAQRAVALLTRAARGYEDAAMPIWLPETLLLRARAHLRLGQKDDAARDLRAGIAAMERHWIDYAGPVAGTGVMDAANALFEEAIRLSLDRGDAAEAFAQAERARAQFARERGGTTVAEVQQHLRGSGAAVLELVTTPAEAIAFVVRENDVRVARAPFDRTQTNRLSRRALYDALIRPSVASLENARMLIVVPDGALQGVPFAALDDGTRPLVARMPVAIAASAASLRHGEAVPLEGALAVALPSGESVGSVALPETRGELADIGALYRRARLVEPGEATFGTFVAAARDAAVIHLAAHTEEGAGETALVFAAGQRVAWKAIAASRLGTPEVVVLAACETMRPPSPQLRALSLAHAFGAAGAENVIGTLAPIADAEARTIFRRIHQELAAGAPAAVALQRAQLDALAHGNGAWADVALLTSRVPR